MEVRIKLIYRFAPLKFHILCDTLSYFLYLNGFLSSHFLQTPAIQCSTSRLKASALFCMVDSCSGLAWQKFVLFLFLCHGDEAIN
uniref:Uncharacterized protein n=1 Tax=Anguilla anguilla TaxID=7936 RepID=A0A0E9WS57_ANGAN